MNDKVRTAIEALRHLNAGNPEQARQLLGMYSRRGDLTDSDKEQVIDHFRKSANQ